MSHRFVASLVRNADRRRGRAHILITLSSNAFDEAVDHALLASLFEGNRQLVSVDDENAAIAELLMEYALADRKGRCGAGRLRHQFALDGERAGSAAAASPWFRAHAGGAGGEAWPAVAEAAAIV